MTYCYIDIPVITTTQHNTTIQLHCNNITILQQVETVRVIFSWNDADPVGDDPDQVMYHGNQNRGSFSLNLLGIEQEIPPEPADVQVLTTTVTNVRLSLMHAN